LTAFLATHTLARFLLPRFNAFIGEKKALLLYQSLFFVMALLIWRIRNLIAVSALIAALGIPIGTAPQVSVS
jgi:Na+/melibiose symporter-like transporter